MMAALLLKRRQPSRPVVLIDPALQAGGNYRGITLGKHRFDQGMRMLYETGIPEFDQLIHGILPMNDWHVMPGNTKDIAGLYWRGQVQTHTPYPDLRRLPPEQYEQCLSEVLQAIKRDSGQDAPHAQAYLLARFGRSVAQLLGDVLEKLYVAPAQTLDVIACKQPAMDRVALFDCTTLEGQLEHAALRARVAWPDQLTLPALRPFNQAGLYPRRYGMDAVIAALQEQLEEVGVVLQLGESIQRIEQRDGRIHLIQTLSGQVYEPVQLLWTGGVPTLAKLLGIAPPPLPAVPQSKLVYVLLNRPPEAMGGLYHFYCYDKGLYSFRVTHYASYCPDASQIGGYPLCVEMWQVPQEMDAGILALQELEAMGIDTAGAVVAGVAQTPNLHAMCGREAIQAMRHLRQDVQAQKLENLLLAGVAPEEGLLLLYEVWRDMYARIEGLL